MMKVVLFYLITYVFVFNPPITIFSIASLRLLYPFIFVWMLSNQNWFKRYLSLFKKELSILYGVVSFCLFWYGVGGDFSFVKDSISLIIDSFFISGFLIFLQAKFGIKKNIYQVFYIVAIIAAIISVVLFLIPSLNSFAKANFYLADANAGFLKFRCYGIASGLSFDYSIIIGLALCLCLIKDKKILEYFFILVFFFTSLINARTGIIMPLILLGYLIFVRFKLSYILLGALVVSGMSYFTQTSIYNDNIETFMWIENGLLEISDVVLNTNEADESTLNTLTEYHMIFPSNVMGWIFGTGENLYNAILHRSDIGYIIQLNYGGLIYMLLIFLSLIYPILDLYRKIETKNIILLCFVLLTFVVCNFKGNLYNSNGVLRIYYFLYIYNKYSCWSNFRYIVK